MPTPMFRPRVLVADDDPSALRRTTRILGALGADVVAADDGRRALALLDSMQPLPDLIITGVQMRDVGGEQLLRRMWASEWLAAIPVVAVAATDTDLPFDLVLERPLGEADLRAALRLERRVAHARARRRGRPASG